MSLLDMRMEPLNPPPDEFFKVNEEELMRRKLNWDDSSSILTNLNRLLEKTEGVSPQTTARGDTRGHVRRDQRGDVRGAGGPTAVGGGGGMHIDDEAAAADDDADNDIVYCHKCGHIEDSIMRTCINKKCKLNTSNTHHNNLLQNRRLLPQVTLPNTDPLGVNGSLNFVYILPCPLFLVKGHLWNTKKIYMKYIRSHISQNK